MHRFNLIQCVGLLVALGLSGCANLDVSKISPVARANRSDEGVEGFRYYLSRPYVVVQEAVLISERHSLVMANDNQSVTYVTGNRAGATARIDQLQKHQPGSHHLNQASENEIAQMREILENASRRAGTANASDDVADENVRLVAYDASKPLDIPADFVPEKAPTGYNASSTKDISGKINIVYLPDLDEQYAVRNRNCLAKSAFIFNFRDGWQLTDVGAEHDSTTVTIKLLETIDKAVTAAAAIEKAGISTSSPSAKDIGTVSAGSYFELVEATYIKPGMYRINKPWEMTDANPQQGCGLLEKMGLPVVTRMYLQPAVRIPPPQLQSGNKNP